MHSIKLTKVSFGGDQLAFKVKYQRSGDPTANNPLNGLLDYSQMAPIVEGLHHDASSQEIRATRDQARNALAAKLKTELSRQQIDQGKFKLIIKNKALSVAKGPSSSMRKDKDKTVQLRLEGLISDALINHGHFQENQKMTETGNSIESLKWIIKLDYAASPDTLRLKLLFDQPAFRKQVDTIAQKGLARGDALELVIDVIRDLVTTTLEKNGLNIDRVKFSLQRPNLLDGATVVIGETVDFGKKNGIKSKPDFELDSKIKSPCGYQDFSILLRQTN